MKTKQFTGKRVSVPLTPALESAVTAVARELGGSEAQAARRLMEWGMRNKPRSLTAKQILDFSHLIGPKMGNK